MGRIINPSEIKEQSNRIIKALQEENKNLLSTLKTLEHFMEENQLAGKAWDSMKNRLTVHADMIKCMVLANQSMIQDSRILALNCGDEELYEDELTEIISSCQKQIYNCMRQIESNHNKMKHPVYAEACGHYTQSVIRRYESIISNYEQIIAETRQKIERIDEIEDNLKGLFEAYNRFVQMVKKLYRILMAKNDLANSGFASFVNAGFSFILKQSWILFRGKLKKEENFRENLQKQFGFNEETSAIMWDVYLALETKYPDASQKEIDWRFTRLMGGFVYDEPDDGCPTLLDKLGFNKWKDVAGNAIDAEKWKELPTIKSQTYVSMSEDEYFVDFLGISKEDYTKLRYYVRLQHLITGDLKKYTLPENIEKIEDEQINNFKTWKKTYEERTGHVCESEQEFLDIWNQNFAAVSGTGDFAHQMITTSTYLANDLDKDFIFSNLYLKGDDAHVEDMEGWLGDATLTPYSLGPDDYKADLDFVNIIAYMDNKDMDFMTACNTYYSDIEAGKSRADIFLETIPLEKVKAEIYPDIPFFEDKLSAEEFDMLYKNALKENRPDVYNFIISLENRENKMEEEAPGTK